MFWTVILAGDVLFWEKGNILTRGLIFSYWKKCKLNKATHVRSDQFLDSFRIGESVVSLAEAKEYLNLLCHPCAKALYTQA